MQCYILLYSYMYIQFSVVFHSYLHIYRYLTSCYFNKSAKQRPTSFYFSHLHLNHAVVEITTNDDNTKGSSQILVHVCRDAVVPVCSSTRYFNLQFYFAE